MRCPHCGSLDDKVLDSRPLANGAAVRRRRQCLTCGYRFTSYERIVEQPFMVVKRDGRREPFDRGKIEKGLVGAVKKRPVSQMDIECLVNEVEDQIMVGGGTGAPSGANEVASSVIGELVLEKLHLLDNVAYIRFASIYRHFENLDEFVKEIEKLNDNT
jgi:transcriptional repressor NrdR